MLDEGGAARPDRASARAIHAVQQLACRDHADRAIRVAYRLVERCAPPLDIHQHRRVDQDGHAPPGGPMALRPASTSCAKPSSGDGASSISARHLSADTRCPVLAGRICKTATPLRTTSISSPAPTRLTTAENSRATWVALSLVMF